MSSSEGVLLLVTKKFAQTDYLKSNLRSKLFETPTAAGKFWIPALRFVSLKVYDMLGKKVKTLVNEIKPARIYSIEFDGSDLPSGIYFYKIEAGNFIQVRKMILVK